MSEVHSLSIIAGFGGSAFIQVLIREKNIEKPRTIKVRNEDENIKELS